MLADPQAPSFAVAWAVIGQRALPLMGRGDEVEPLVARLREVRSQVDGTLIYPASFAEIQALTFTGRLEEAQRTADAYSEFTTSGQYIAWGMMKTFTGHVEVARGRLPAAVAGLSEAVAALSSNSLGAWGYPAKIALVQAYSLLGCAEDAERVLASARERSGRHLVVFDPSMRVAEAWLAAAQGTPVRAIELAHKAAEAAAEDLPVRRRGRGVARRRPIRRPVGRHPASPNSPARLDGALAPLYAEHAAAVAAADAAALDRCATEFERLGALLSAADSAAQATTIHTRHDDKRACSASAAVANRLAALCGGARTPAILAADQPLPLTAREREIANLVAADMSNREIAERLTLSVRTVEGHIYRACAKFDVADREELAALILRE